MADIFDFYVYDDRSIRFAIAEPIMMEDKDVTQFRFRIPKVLNNIDMTDWEWWFIFVNAKKVKYTTRLTLEDDEDDPDNFSVATYTVGYGFSGYVGSVSFSIEALNVSGEDIVNEWHTRTYNTTVTDTLQGSRAVIPEPGGQAGTGLTEAMKQALLQIARKVAYIDEHGQTYYDALYDALYPSASLVSISAVYTQRGTVYDTDNLDSLKDDLVVTAHYDDSSTSVVTTYTLNGTLSEGTSTITVIYSGQTTTFNVTVTEKPKAWYTGVALNLGAVETGTINETTGADAESTTQKRTDYIDIEGIHLLSSRLASDKTATGNSAKFYFYDADKDFISSKSFNSGNNKVTISTVPQSTKYVRFTAPLDNMGDEATAPFEFMPWAKPKTPCFNGAYSIAKEDSTMGNMNTTTGQPGDGGMYTSPYIPIYGFNTLSFAKNGADQTYIYITLYDVNKNYIAPWSASSVSMFNSTNYPFREVAYIRWYSLGASDFPASITNAVTTEA